MTFVTPIQPNVAFDLEDQEILNEIQTRIRVASNGVLTDFSPASPLAAITEGQAYATALIANNLNTLPEQFLFRFLNILGLNVEVERQSKVIIDFVKTNGFNGSVIIPRGFIMFTSDGTVFTLDEQVVLGQALTRGIGFATSLRSGAIQNVPANTINGFSDPIPGLASINNPEPARGGANQETREAALSRGLSFLQFRHLVSPRDFEDAARGLIGSTYVVKAYSYFEIQDYVFANQDILFEGESEIDTLDEFGRRNIYLVTSDNTAKGITLTLQNRIKNYFVPRTQAGTEVKFLNPDERLISVEVTATGEPPVNVVNRMATVMRQNQSILYRGIGSNFTASSFYNIVERFFDTDLVEIFFTDEFGDSLYSVTNRERVLIAPSPAAVFRLTGLKVITTSGIVYEYDFDNDA